MIRKLLDSRNPPEDAYLVVDKRLALRLSGFPHENRFSLKHKPWFDFSVYHNFKKSDFIPQPNIDSVVWRITEKDQPLLAKDQKQSWERFIKVGFGQGTQIKQNFGRILTSKQMQNLQSELDFSLKVKPGNLSLDQWLWIYRQIKLLGYNFAYGVHNRG